MIRLSPRYFILPLLALVVIGSLPAPAESGRAETRGGCGPAVTHIVDPALRATMASFDRTQSAAAGRICDLYHNSLGASAGR